MRKSRRKSNMGKTSRLNVIQVRNLKAKGRYADGGGLYLQVRSRTNKYWLFCYVRGGKAHSLGLGALHTVGLPEARERAREARLKLLDGIDPLAVKQTAK